MGTENWTGPQADLSEDTKTFLDDLTDQHIINLSKRYIAPSLSGAVLRNKHGVTLGFTMWALVEARTYCQYLIAIGAVKSVQPQAS